MPIGLVSDSDFDKELESYSPKKSNGEKVEILPAEKSERGRKEGDKNVPDSLRKIIGETHLLEGRSASLQLARDFGISDSSVSAYAKGATSTSSYHSPSPSIKNHISKQRNRAIKKAQTTLNQALNSITQEKLDNMDVSDLSGVAKDMSVIIKNLEPKETKESGETESRAPQFVIFAPQFRDERTFESITVQE